LAAKAGAAARATRSAEKQAAIIIARRIEIVLLRNHFVPCHSCLADKGAASL
jgi:hypothetical protein